MMNYGFEIEFFAADTQKKQIFNAGRLITDFLQVEAFPKIQIASEYNCPVFLNTRDFNLIADGTVFEIVGKRTACEPSMIDGYGFAIKTINNSLNEILKYSSQIFKIETLLSPYAKTPEWEFINPGGVYNSGKLTYNAYSNTSNYEDKKEESNKLVNFRTNGFHIHIRFDDAVAKKLFKNINVPVCNELIQLLDKVYQKYFPSCLSFNTELMSQEILRTQDYSKLGNYRIKSHSGGYSTLEYRQFSSAFFLLPLDIQQKILHDFAMTVRKFVKRAERCYL